MSAPVTTLTPSRPDVLDEVFDGEAVLVNLRTGRYYALDAVGTAVWRTATDGRPLDAATQELAAAHQLDAELLAPVLTAFAARLVAEELVTAEPPLGPRPSPPPPSPG